VPCAGTGTLWVRPLSNTKALHTKDIGLFAGKPFREIALMLRTSLKGQPPPPVPLPPSRPISPNPLPALSPGGWTGPGVAQDDARDRQVHECVAVGCDAEGGREGEGRERGTERNGRAIGG